MSKNVYVGDLSSSLSYLVSGLKYLGLLAELFCLQQHWFKYNRTTCSVVCLYNDLLDRSSLLTVQFGRDYMSLRAVST